LLACSSLYRTKPVGPRDQPDFVNAVARLCTHLDPLSLLARLQGIERAHGRVRDGTRWGPRTLDLDLLLYGREQIDEPGLRVPHPEIANRAFVLVPLAELGPEPPTIPGGRSLADLLNRASCAGIELIDRRSQFGCCPCPKPTEPAAIRSRGSER
jgi:2-amino-4-hydroxy-6-hydroxymethyldihydropteridine diphosphokinase